MLLNILTPNGEFYVPFCNELLEFLAFSYESIDNRKLFLNIISKSKIQYGSPSFHRIYMYLAAFIKNIAKSRGCTEIVQSNSELIELVNQIDNLDLNENKQLVLINIREEDFNESFKEFETCKYLKKTQFASRLISNIYNGINGLAKLKKFHNYLFSKKDYDIPEYLNFNNTIIFINKMRREANLALRQNNYIVAEIITRKILFYLASQKESAKINYEIAITLSNLGMIAAKTHHYIEASLLHIQSKDIFEIMDYKRLIIREIRYLASIKKRQHLLDEAKDMYAEALKLSNQFGMEDEIAIIYHNLGQLLLEREKLSDAATNHKDALKIFEKLKLNKYIAIEYHHLGIIERIRPQLADSEYYHRNALKLFEKLGLKAFIACTKHQLGLIEMDKKHYLEAKDLHFQSIDIFNKTHFKPYIAFGYHHLGIIAQRQQRFDEAKIWHFDALKIFKQLHWEKYIAIEYHQLGVVSRFESNLDESIRMHKKAFSIFNRLGLESYKAVQYHQLGIVSRELLDFDKAIMLFERARKIFILLEREIDIAMEYYQLGLTASKDRQLKEAANWHIMSLEIDERRRRPKYVADNCRELGKIYYLMENRDESESWHDRALHIFEQLGLEEDIAEEYYYKGLINSDRKNYEDAYLWLSKSLKIRLRLSHVASAVNIRIKLGYILMELARFEEAQKMLECALSISEEYNMSFKDMIERELKNIQNQMKKRDK